MATPDWDDAGFDDEQGDQGGFLNPNEAQRKRVDAPSLPTSQVPVEEKRSSTFWVGTVALFLLLVAIIGGGLYLLVQPSVEEQAFYAEPTSAEVKAEAVPEAQVELEKVEATESAKPTETQTKAPEPILKSSSINEQVNANTPERKARPEIAEKRIVEKPLVEKPVIEKPAITPKRDAAAVQPAPKKDPEISTKQSATKSDPLYVVQVYSSPSRDDADEWLQRLRSKNVSDGYIAEQQVKGESWYRVRFGQFSSKEDAEAIALKLGFKQPWVARVR